MPNDAAAHLTLTGFDLQRVRQMANRLHEDVIPSLLGRLDQIVTAEREEKHTFFGMDVQQCDVLPPSVAVIMTSRMAYRVNLDRGEIVEIDAELVNEMAVRIARQNQARIENLFLTSSVAEPRTETRPDLFEERPSAGALRAMQNLITSGYGYGSSCIAPLITTVEAESSTFRKAPTWEPIKGLKTIFHDAGRFIAPDGRLFDYVFPELMRDPSLPVGVVPTLNQLARNAPFEGRMNEREEDMLRIGTKFTNDAIGLPGVMKDAERWDWKPFEGIEPS